MVAGVNSSQDNKMSPVTKGTLIGGAAGVAISGLSEAFCQKDNLKMLKDSFTSEQANLTKLNAELASCDWPKHMKEMYEKSISRSTQSIKEYAAKIKSVKKAMPKEVLKNIATAPITYIALAVGVGIGLAVKFAKNKNAQKAQ